MVNTVINPTNPSIGDQRTIGGTRQEWDGTKWKNISFGNHEVRIDKNTRVTKALLQSLGLSGNFGFFNKGFTYTEVGDVGIDDDNQFWLYNGSLPFEVNKGTVPSEPDYSIFEHTTADNAHPSSSISFMGRTQYDKNYENLTIADFGEVGGSNASPAINAMIQEVGYFTLPTGLFNVQDQLIVPNGTYDMVYRGQGMGASRLNCVGMSGTSLIVNEDAEQWIRLCIRDLAIRGEIDHCIDFQVTGNYQLYQSEFRNLILEGVDGAGFRANQHFSSSWFNVHCSSDNSNAFDLEGGNSNLLMNCYAHKVGEGMAGYRIKRSATLIACNGIDENVKNAWWAHFGDLATNRSYRVHVLGGNAEDWNLGAYKLENFGFLKVNSQTQISRDSGYYDSLITAVNGSNHRVELDDEAGIVSKGSTLNPTSLAPIRSSGSMFLKRHSLELGSIYGKFERTDQGLVYQGAEEAVISNGYLEQATAIRKLASQEDVSFKQQAPATLTPNSLNPSAEGKNTVKTANTLATTIRTIATAEDGVELSLLIQDSNTTLVHGYGGANRLILQGGVDLPVSNGDVIKFIGNNDRWVQV